MDLDGMRCYRSETLGVLVEAGGATSDQDEGEAGDGQLLGKLAPDAGRGASYDGPRAILGEEFGGQRHGWAAERRM